MEEERRKGGRSRDYGFGLGVAKEDVDVGGVGRGEKDWGNDEGKKPRKSPRPAKKPRKARGRGFGSFVFLGFLVSVSRNLSCMCSWV